MVEVLFGRDFAGNPIFHASEDTDVRIVGDPQDRIGFSLSASDVNGDGVQEVLYGTPFNNRDAGTAYLLSLAVPEPSAHLSLIACAVISGLASKRKGRHVVASTSCQPQWRGRPRTVRAVRDSTGGRTSVSVAPDQFRGQAPIEPGTTASLVRPGHSRSSRRHR